MLLRKIVLYMTVSLVFLAAHQPLGLQASSQNHFNVEKAFTSLIEASQRLLSLKEEAQQAKNARLLSVHFSESRDDRIIQVYLVAREIRQKQLISKYPQALDHGFQEHGSVGVALLGKISADELISILIREAQLLSTPATLLLKNLYWYPTQGFKRHDPRILDLFKTLAEEGNPRSQFEYGVILLEGIGVEDTQENRTRGLDLILKADLPESNLYLANLAYQKGDREKFQLFLERAALQGNEQAQYNLGVFYMDEYQYAQAIELFQQLAENGSKKYQDYATHELARMMYEGWGFEESKEQGVELLKDLLKKTKDKELKRLIQKNLKRMIHNL